MYKSIGHLFLTKDQRNCLHPDDAIITDWDGRWHFDGDPWDDIREHLICQKCGAEVKLVNKRHIHKIMEEIPL
jgi:hypothetical protein